MTLPKIPSFLKRTYVLYLGLAALSLLFIDQQQLNQGIQTRRLNNLIPESYAVLLDPGQEANSKKIRRMLRYYQHIIHRFPNMTDAQNLLGISYYFSGDDQAAITALKKAAAQSPQFFWTHYNLGIIYFKQEKYLLASKNFEVALKTNPQSTIKFILSSRMIYADILKKSEEFNTRRLAKNLESGYINAKGLLIYTQMIINTPQAQKKIPKEIHNLNVQIF